MKEQMASLLSLFVNRVPNRIARKLCGDTTPIFMLHRIADSNEIKQQQTLEHIEWCLKYIRKHRYNPISLIELCYSYINGTPIKPKSVVFTFDDGFYDQYSLASPLFNRYDIPYTCFLITDFIDKKLWPWDDQIRYIITHTKKSALTLNFTDSRTIKLQLEDNKNEAKKRLHNEIKLSPQDSIYSWVEGLYEQAEVDIPKDIPEIYQPMSWQQAQTLIDQGHDICSHTLSHRILSRLSDAESKREIEDSLKRINQKLTGTAPLFAYPTGRPTDYTQREVDFLKQKNIIASVNTFADSMEKNKNIFHIPRYFLPENRFDFIQYLSFFEKMKQRFLKS